MATLRHRVLVAAPASTALKLQDLAKAGFETTQVHSGVDALARLRAEDFDAVVAQTTAPAIDGVLLARQLQDHDVLTPVIVVEAKVTDDERLRAAEEGVQQVLQAPVPMERLARALELVVAAGRRQKNALRSLLVEARESTSYSATEAKNQMGEMLEAAMTEGAVLVTKHDRPKAALVSLDHLEALARPRNSTLEQLTREFDAMRARMQSTESKAALRAAFNAPAAEFGIAARAAAKKRG